MELGNPMAWNALLSSWDAWLLTFTLVVVVPVVGSVRFRRLQALPGAIVPPRTKLQFYSRIVGVQWLLSGAMLLVLRRHGLSAADAGERLADAPVTLVTTAVLLAILAVVAALILRRVRRARPAVLTSAVGRLQRLLPASGTEMAGFVVVSVTAGVCEEFLYRGWIVTFLQVATGSVWAAVAIGSVVFGIGHAYQGPKGMLRTGLIGLQLAVLFVMVGSLLPGQVLHTGVDILSGYALAIAASRLDTSPPPAT